MPTPRPSRAGSASHVDVRRITRSAARSASAVGGRPRPSARGRRWCRAAPARGAVRREREPLAVGREHREAVEARRVGDALEAGAVDVHRPDVELAALRVAVVRREEDASSRRDEERRERGGVEVRDLPRVACRRRWRRRARASRGAPGPARAAPGSRRAPCPAWGATRARRSSSSRALKNAPPS